MRFVFSQMIKFPLTVLTGVSMLVGCSVVDDAMARQSKGTATSLPSKLPATLPTQRNVSQKGFTTVDTTGELKGCKINFYQTPPQVSQKIAVNTQALCFNGFAVLYSGMTKTPIWSAENLTNARIVSAKNMTRVDNFHEEDRLPAGIRSRLKDYTQTGYDRGHLSPNGDMPDSESQFDSFSLANIAPQNPTNNQRTWVKLETKTRAMAQKYGQAYVVTGVAFIGENVKKLKDNVIVPTHFFKAIYLPKTQQAVAFISPNDDSQKIEQISLNELQNRTGVIAFPTLNSTIKNAVVTID